MEDHISKIKQLIEQGRYLDARALTQEALKNDSGIELQQLHAMALSKSGMPGLAKEFLEKTYTEHPEEPETAGILGGIYKELFKRTEDSNFAIQSRDTYHKNFSITGNYYTGINAATMSAIAGQARKGREIAKEVIEKVGAPNEFWQVATLGEAFLLSKEYEKSVDCYLKARQQAGTDWGKISSVYNQLWLIKHYMHVPSDILKIFVPPSVSSFIGHMIDRDDRPSPRFPASIQDAIKAAIKSSIKSQKASIGYCSLACGGDILFAEAMAEEGGEVNIFLPFNKKDFVRASVSFAGDEWVNRFEALMAKHQVSYLTQEAFDNHSDLFSVQSKVVLGATLLRRAVMHSDAYLITVLSDFDFSRMEGGTRDNMSLWPFPDKIINISPNNFIANSGAEASVTTTTPQAALPSDRPTLYSLVVDLDNSEEDALTKLFELIQRETDEVVVPPLANCILDGKWVAGFSGLRPLVDFVKQLRKNKGISQHQLRLSIGGGPIQVTDYHQKEVVQYKQMDGPHVLAALDAHRYCSTGTCIALSPIAYELALYKIEIELLSRISPNNAEMVDVFKVLH